MRLGFALAAAAALGACESVGGVAPTAASPADDPAAFHDRLLTLDTHVDIPLTFATAATDPGGLTASQVDLPKMRAGGLDAAFFILYSGQGPLTAEGYAEARDTVETKYRAITRMTAGYPDQIALATTPEDVRRAVREGKLVALMGMENAYPLGESVEDVAMWAERGVTYFGITHVGHNQFGDSSNPNPALGDEDSRHGGLSDLGRELIAAINRSGAMIDISHAGKATVMETLALTQAPVVASHSSVMGVAENPRNLDDEQLHAIAANGGVVQIVAFASYVLADPAEKTAEIEALRAEMGLETSAARAGMDAQTRAAYLARLGEINARYPQASVSEFVDHIDYAVEVMGIDHVGISSDFDGGGGVLGWMDASETEAVTDELLARGYSAEEIGQIWGGNLLRVLGEAQAVGRRLREEQAGGN